MWTKVDCSAYCLMCFDWVLTPVIEPWINNVLFSCCVGYLGEWQLIRAISSLYIFLVRGEDDGALSRRSGIKLYWSSWFQVRTDGIMDWIKRYKAASGEPRVFFPGEMSLVLVDKVDHPSLLHPHKKKMGQILWGAKHNDQRSLFPVCGLFRLPLSNTLSCVYGQLF